MGIPFTNSLIPVIHIIPVDSETRKYITLGDVFGDNAIPSPFTASDHFDFAGSFQFKRFTYDYSNFSCTIEFIDPTAYLFEKVMALVNRGVYGQEKISALDLEVTLGWAFSNKSAQDVVYPKFRDAKLRAGERLTVSNNELLGSKYNIKITTSQYTVSTTGIHYTLVGAADAHIGEQLYSQSTSVMPKDCQYFSILYKLAAEMNLLLLVDDSVNVDQLRKTAAKFSFDNKTNIDNFLRTLNAVNEKGSQYKPLDFSISTREEDAIAAIDQINGMINIFNRTTPSVNYVGVEDVVGNNKFAFGDGIAALQRTSEDLISSAGSSIQPIKNPPDDIPISQVLGSDLVNPYLQWGTNFLSGATASAQTQEEIEEKTRYYQLISKPDPVTLLSYVRGEGGDFLTNSYAQTSSNREKQMLADSLDKIRKHYEKVKSGEYKDWKVLIIREDPNVTSIDESILTPEGISSQYTNFAGKKFLGIYSHFAKDEEETNLTTPTGKDTVSGFSLTSNFNVDDSIAMVTQRKQYEAIAEHCGNYIPAVIVDCYNKTFGNTAKSSLTTNIVQKNQAQNATSQNINAIRNNITPALEPIWLRNMMPSNMVWASADKIIDNYTPTTKNLLEMINKELDLPEDATQSDYYQASNKQQDGSLFGGEGYVKGAQFPYFLDSIVNKVTERVQSSINPDATTLKAIKQITRVSIFNKLNEINKYGAFNINYNKQAIELTLKTIGDIALSRDLINGSLLYLKIFNPNGTKNNFLTGFYLLLGYRQELNSDSMFTTEMQIQYYELLNNHTTPDAGDSTDLKVPFGPGFITEGDLTSSSNLNNALGQRGFGENTMEKWTTISNVDTNGDFIVQSVTSPGYNLQSGITQSATNINNFIATGVSDIGKTWSINYNSAKGSNYK